MSKSAKDDKRENQDLKARLAALASQPVRQPEPAVPPQINFGSDPKAATSKLVVSESFGSKTSKKTLCHYMYVSPEEDLFFTKLIGTFIVATGHTISASEALRVMMFAAAAASDNQIVEAYARARAGDGKRMTEK